MSNRLQLLPSAVALAVVLPCLSACSSKAATPARQLTVEEQRGRDVYQTSCAVCHNAYKKEPLQGPPLVALFRSKEMPSGIPATDQHVHDTIVLGRRNMPPFNGVLDDKQINDLMAFLHTL